MLTMERFGITDRQKLLAMEYRFYQHAKWVPKLGDYYTITRADNQLCRIVGETDTHFEIMLSWPDGTTSKEPTAFGKEGFSDHGFGDCRMYCPEWVFAT